MCLNNNSYFVLFLRHVVIRTKKRCVFNMLIDECPNSGEDSEEDVITDYLGSSHSDCDRIPIINGDLGRLNLHGNIITETGYTKDNTEKTAITMSEGTDEQQQQHSLLSLGTNSQAQTNPLVPIISVTPHSPGLAKNYPVLGNLFLLLCNIMHYISLNSVPLDTGKFYVLLWLTICSPPCRGQLATSA